MTTDTQDLKRYKYGYSSDEWGMGRSLGLIPDPAGNVCLFADAHEKLEGLQAEVTRKDREIAILKLDVKDYAEQAGEALARLAELEVATK